LLQKKIIKIVDDDYEKDEVENITKYLLIEKATVALLNRTVRKKDMDFNGRLLCLGFGQ